MIRAINKFNFNNTVIPFRGKTVMQKAVNTSRKLDKNGYHLDNDDFYYNFLYSEIQELKDAKQKNDYNNMQEEIGDILFDTIMLADHYGINPDIALKNTNAKISKRIDLVNLLVSKPLIQYPYEDRVKFWQQAKNILKTKDNIIAEDIK